MSKTQCNVRAYYTASKKVKFVTIKQADTNMQLAEIEVSGKVEARKIAKEYNAVCWNF